MKVNPNLGDAGDMLGHSDIASLANLLSAFPKNRFFVTMLSRENQHELAVAARKFGNLMVFGGPAFFNKYAYTLESNPVIPAIEIGLLLIFLVHVYKTITMFLGNQAARPVRYQQKKYAGGASRKSLGTLSDPVTTRRVPGERFACAPAAARSTSRLWKPAGC